AIPPAWSRRHSAQAILARVPRECPGPARDDPPRRRRLHGFTHGEASRGPHEGREALPVGGTPGSSKHRPGDLHITQGVPRRLHRPGTGMKTNGRPSHEEQASPEDMAAPLAMEQTFREGSANPTAEPVNKNETVGSRV